MAQPALVSSVFDQLLKDRIIWLGSEVRDDNANEICAKILLLAAEDPKRDMAGVLERIGPFRWRLVIPWPQNSSKLDVFELRPVEQQPEG